MAKGQVRGNREPKKPKKPKQVVAPVTTTFLPQQKPNEPMKHKH